MPFKSNDVMRVEKPVISAYVNTHMDTLYNIKEAAYAPLTCFAIIIGTECIGCGLAKVGNTVDLTTAKYTNEIGATMLMGSFTDEEFNSELPTLYYARVIEIPTPRWSTYDAVRNNLPLLTDVQATIQERAWSSPIWFMPAQEVKH